MKALALAALAVGLSTVALSAQAQAPPERPYAAWQALIARTTAACQQHLQLGPGQPATERAAAVKDCGLVIALRAIGASCIGGPRTPTRMIRPAPGIWQ